MDRATYERNVRVAQSLMSSLGVDIVADGKWGKYTQKAYVGLTPAGRDFVDVTLRGLRTSATDLGNFRDQERKSVDTSSSYTGSVAEAIRSAAAEAGIAESTLRGFIGIESNFNPTAVNGSSRGLAQLQPAAWQDAQAQNRTLPGYEMVFDPLQNARAAAAYMKVNQRRLIKGGFPADQIDGAVLYLAHQQGAGGFLELWNASQGKRTTSYVTDRAMLGNPPQDGRGATTDKSEFFRRWMNVARRRVSTAS